MNFTGKYSELSEIKRQLAHELLEKTFAPILTYVDKENLNSPLFHVQLEIIHVQAQRILNHRVLFISYTADRIFFGKKLYLQHIGFVTDSKLPETGVYETVILKAEELYHVANTIESSTISPCQVLHLDTNVKEVMSLDAFKPYLPQKLSQVDLKKIKQRNHKIKQVKDNDGLIDFMG